MLLFKGVLLDNCKISSKRILVLFYCALKDSCLNSSIRVMSMGLLLLSYCVFTHLLSFMRQPFKVFFEDYLRKVLCKVYYILSDRHLIVWCLYHKWFWYQFTTSKLGGLVLIHGWGIIPCYMYHVLIFWNLGW